MYRKSATLFVVCVLVLVPLFGASGPAVAQSSSDSPFGFPDDIVVDELAAGDVDPSAAAPGSLELERVTIPADASVGSREVSASELLYVERGAVTLVDSLGLTSTLTEGQGVHLRAGAIYEARNDSTDNVTILRLSVTGTSTTSGTPVASSMATPIAVDGTGDVVVISLAEFSLTEIPASPATLFLDRATWKSGVDSGPYTQNGPIGVLAESGTLTISSPSGIDGQLNEGDTVLLPAGQPLRTRNDGEGDAVALMFGVIPAGGAAVTAGPQAEASTQGSTGTSTSATAAGTVLYQADTSGGLADWSGAGGWQSVSGLLVNDGSSHTAVFSGAPFQIPVPDYAVEVEMQYVRGGNSFGIVARGGDSAGYWAGFGDCYDDAIRIWSGPPPHSYYCDRAFAKTRMELDSEWHTYRLEVQGNSIRVLLDDTPVIETTDNLYLSAGQVGVWSDGAQVTIRRFSVIALGGD